MPVVCASWLRKAAKLESVARPRQAWGACLIAVAWCLLPTVARAEDDAAAREKRAESQFERALNHYRAGRYRSAIEALDLAIELDPKSKDLIFDLALVQEKLGLLDEAIVSLERYQKLETDPKEVERARLAIERMRGARAEVAAAFFARSLAARGPAPSRSRADAWTIATTGVAAAAALLGTVFGVRAFVLRPERETTSERSIADLRESQASAHHSAQIADVSFVISLIAGSAATALWLRGPADSATLRAPTNVAFTVSGSF